jgi:putative transposase
MLSAAFTHGSQLIALLRGIRCLPTQWLRATAGPEFVSQDLDAWAHAHGIQLDFIRPGKPVENAFVESFNGCFRDKCLNDNWFTSLADARARIEAWRLNYNHVRAHSALGNLALATFTDRFNFNRVPLRVE